MAHYVQGPPRWLLLPVVSAAGGAFAFWGGKGPQDWDWSTGLVVGLAPALAAAITPLRTLAPVLALLFGAAGAVALAPGPASDTLRELTKPAPSSLVLPAMTALPAFLTVLRLREDGAWSWVNGILQMAAALLVPALLWFHGTPIEMSDIAPFPIVAVAHIIGVEATAYLCPKKD